MPNPLIDDVVEGAQPPAPERPRLRMYGAKDPRGPTWADYGRAGVMGARDIASGAGAAIRWAGEELDNPLMLENAREIRAWAAEANEETRKAMTPSAIERMEATITDPVFTGNIMSSLGLKLTRTTPTVVAAVIPATAFSGAVATTLAAAGGAAALNTSSFVDELYAQTDALDDTELQRQSPAYAKLREQFDETEAREQFNEVVRGTLPVWVAAASALTGVAGPAAQVARRFAGAPAALSGRGGVRGIAAGTAEGAASEFIEEGATAAGSQVARVRTGEQAEPDLGAVLIGAAEGAILGGVIGGGANVGQRRSRQNPATLPSATVAPTVSDEEATTAATAKPSTAPAIAGEPASPMANPSTRATQSAPSTVTTPAGPRRRPARGPDPTASPPTTPVTAGTTGSNTGTTNREPTATVEKVGEVGDIAIAAALAPDRPATAPVTTPPAPTPPGTVPTALGPSTTPVPANDQTVTPAGNDNVPVPPAPLGEQGLAQPAARPVTAVSGAAAARAPRVLEDVRPEVVEMNRDDAFQQREALLENQRALRKQEAGSKGRTDLYGKAGQKRAADAANAKSLFDATVPEADVIPTSATQKLALAKRLEDTLAAAEAADIAIPERIVYNAAEPIADHLIWLREVANMKKAFDSPKGPSLAHIQSFLIRERAARAGDFDLMKAERKAEGAQKKRGAQAGVETKAAPELASSPEALLIAKQEGMEEGDIDAPAVGDEAAVPVASAASAEADAVPTVAGKTKRGAVRDQKSEGDEKVKIKGVLVPRAKAASDVRKIELTPQEKIEYAKRLAQDAEKRNQLAGRAVDDKAFTKKVSETLAPSKKIEPEEDADEGTDEPIVLPKKVTPKVAEVVKKAKKPTTKEKVEAAAKRVERNPSQAKIDANNFTKGPVSIQGIPMKIETARGTERSGTDARGRRWTVKMPAHYGDISGTEGADGDPLDVFIGPKPDSDYVLVIEQNNADTGKFDELKSFVGYAHMNAALEDYLASFSDGRGAERFGEFRNMTIAEFKKFIKTVQTKKPLDAQNVREEAEAEALRPLDAPSPIQPSDAQTSTAQPSDRGASGEYLFTKDRRLPPNVTPLRTVQAEDSVALIDTSTFQALDKALMPSIIKKIQAALKGHDVPVYFVSDSDYEEMLGPKFGRSNGVYNVLSDAIYIPARTWSRNDGGTKLSYVLLHELSHAVSSARMFEEQNNLYRISKQHGVESSEYDTAYMKSAYGQVDLLMNFVQGTLLKQSLTDPMAGVLTGEYGFTNPHEFIAEALSNTEFQDILARMDLPPALIDALQLEQATKVSAWTALLDKIRQLLGLSKTQFSAIEGAFSMAERLTYATRDMEMYGSFNSALRTGVPVERVQAMRQFMRKADAAQPVARMVEAPGAVLESSITESVNKLARDALSSTTRSLGDPKWLRMRSMTDMAQLAKSYFKGNSVRRVVNAIEAIRATGSELARQAEPVLADLLNAQRRYKGTPAFENLTGVMHDATMAGVHPDRDLAANTQLGKKSMKGFWGRAQHAELQARYNALPDDLKAVYQKSMKYFQDQHNAMIRQSLENRVLKALGFNDPALADRIFNDTTTEADKELLGDLYEVVVEPGDFRKVTGPYFPLKRFGQFVVKGTYDTPMPSSAHRQIDENTFEFDSQAAAEAFVAQSKNHTTLNSVYVDEATGSLYFLDDQGKEVRVHKNDVDAARRWRVRVQNKHLEFFENRSDAEARRAELTQEGVKMDAVVERRDDPRQAQGDLLSTHMERLLRKVEARDGFKEMSETQQNEVRRAIEQASYAALSSTRIQTSRVQRKYVEGASKDIIRSTAEYASSMAGYLARYQHQSELDAALKDMNKEADAGGDPRTAMGRSTIRNEVMYRINQPNIAPSQHNTTWDRWRHRLLTTSFIGHLASPAYSLINATQPIMVTAPVLGARHGLGSTVSALTKAYHDIGASRTIGAGIAGTVRRARDAQANTNTYVADALDRIKNPRERAVINYLIKHGAIDADAGLEVSKLVDTTRGDQWLSYFEGISRQLPLAVETNNRLATALASYRLEMKRNGGDHDAAMLYAQEMVESTQGIYAGTNVPPVFSSPIASIMFQFKKYGHLIYSLMGQQIGKAIRNESEGDRAEAVKALTFIIGAHMAMAGTVGLPTEPIKALLLGANAVGLTSLTMDDLEEWEREQFTDLFGSDAAEVLTHGLGRALPGGLSMDLSGRMGMQSYLTFGEPKSSEEGDIWSFLGETAAGAPGGMLMDALKGAEDIANGDVVKGMSKAVPVKVIKDAIKAYQGATEGKLSKSGRQIMEPLTMPEAAMRLFGITPGRAAETSLAQGSFSRNTGRTREERSGYMDRWATATPAERRGLWKKIQEWNKDQAPAQRLTFSGLGQYVRRRKAEEENKTVVGGMRVTERDKAVFERVQRLYNN